MKIYFEEAGQIHAIDVMFHPSERTFEQFCDFRQAEAKYLQASREARDAEPEQRGRLEEQALEYLVQAIRHMASGDVDEVPVSAPGSADMVFDGYYIQPGDELDLWRLYAHTVNVINSYQPGGIPEQFSIKVAGKEYHLAAGAINIMAGQGYKVGETLETMEYQRRAESIVQAKPTEIGNIEFNLGVTELAILMREKGVELPAKEAQRAAYIEKQKEVFKAATLEDVLNLRFFLANTLLKTEKRKSIRTFGNRHQASTRKASGQRSSSKRKRR